MERVRTGFGAFVRERRKVRGLSQEDLADLVGVDQTWVSQVERDVFAPARGKIAPLASALGVTRRDLYEWLGEVEPVEGADALTPEARAMVDLMQNTPELMEQLRAQGADTEATLRALAVDKALLLWLRMRHGMA